MGDHLVSAGNISNLMPLGYAKQSLVNNSEPIFLNSDL